MMSDHMIIAKPPRDKFPPLGVCHRSHKGIRQSILDLWIQRILFRSTAEVFVSKGRALTARRKTSR